MKVLFIRFSSLGDILLTFPLISFFRKKYPDAEIEFLTKKEYAELLTLNSDINKTILFDKNSDSLSSIRKLIKDGQYDFIFDLHNNIRSNIAALFTQSRKGLFKKHSLKKFLLVKFKINLLKNSPSIIVRYFLATKKFNLLNQDEFTRFYDDYRISATEHEQTNFLNRFPELSKFKIRIAICPAAKHKTKMFPQNKIIEIGKRLAEDKSLAILLLGSKEERNYCGEIAELISKTQCFNLAGLTNIPETLAAMNECHIVVANDSGLMHLANLSKRPLVAIFGSTVRELGFYPAGKNAMVFEIEGLKCRPCSHIGRKECPKKHFRCMRDIDEKLILGQIKNILYPENL